MSEIMEYSAAALALAGIGLMTMRRRLGWILNFASCLLYARVFFESKLYGDSGLQFFFAAMQLWGWMHWNRHRTDIGLRLRYLSFDEAWNTLLMVLAGTLLLGSLLHHYTDTDVPWIDAFCTAASILGQVLQVMRFRENWWVWMLVNLVYMPLYLQKGLTATALLYGLFFAMACWGLLQWNNILRQQQKTQDFT